MYILFKYSRWYVKSWFCRSGLQSYSDSLKMLSQSEVILSPTGRILMRHRYGNGSCWPGGQLLGWCVPALRDAWIMCFDHSVSFKRTILNTSCFFLKKEWERKSNDILCDSHQVKKRNLFLSVEPWASCLSWLWSIYRVQKNVDPSEPECSWTVINANIQFSHECPPCCWTSGCSSARIAWWTVSGL